MNTLRLGPYKIANIKHITFTPARKQSPIYTMGLTHPRDQPEYIKDEYIISGIILIDDNPGLMTGYNMRIEYEEDGIRYNYNINDVELFILEEDEETEDKDKVYHFGAKQWTITAQPLTYNGNIKLFSKFQDEKAKEQHDMFKRITIKEEIK